MVHFLLWCIKNLVAGTYETKTMWTPSQLLLIYVPTVLMNLIAIAVAFASYSSATTRFETVALSILIILYVIAHRSSFENLIAFSELDLFNGRVHICLLKLLKDPRQQLESETETQALGALDWTHRRSHVHSVGRAALVLLAGYKFLAATLPSMKLF